MSIIVDKLLEEPFLNRTLENQIRIVMDGKPRPALNMSALTVGDDGVVNTANFEPVIYDQVMWLTGSESQQGFFCWPCLLYIKDSVWKIDDLAFLSEGMLKHEKTPDHIQASLNYKIFVSQHLNMQKSNVDECQFNEMVQRNRDILKFLIDAVINIVNKDQPPRKRIERQCRINPEICVKVLMFQRNYAGRRRNQIDDVIELVKTCPTLVDDITEAITKVLKKMVKNEVQKSTFASLILSEHSTNPSKSQISTILRYTKKGKVCERFLGFTNFLEKKSADLVYNSITRVIQELDISKKLLAHSIDGAVLKTNQLNDVINFLDRDYPNSYFVPSYYHELFHILQQNLAAYKECTHFFKIMSVMENYFIKNSKQWKLFETFMFGRTNNLSASKLFISEPFIKFVNSHRKHFIEFLNIVIQNCPKWDADDITNACGFQQFLKEFQTIFLLQVCSSVIQQIANLDKELKSNALENMFGSDMVPSVLKKLSIEKEIGFEKIWNSTIDEINSQCYQESKRLKPNFNEKMDHYKEFYNTIITLVIQEISVRFKNLDKLEFCGMLNKENGVYSVEDSGLKEFFNYYLMQMNSEKYDFDLERLMNEVRVLRANNETFCDKNVYDLLEFLTDLKGAFKYVNKLVEFILTMPFKPLSLNVNSSKFEKIDKFSYSTEDVIALGDVSVLHIESDLLQDIKRNINFYDDVISVFFKKNRSIELLPHKP